MKPSASLTDCVKSEERPPVMSLESASAEDYKRIKHGGVELSGSETSAGRRSSLLQAPATSAATGTTWPKPQTTALWEM